MSVCAALSGLALLNCLAQNPACLPPDRLRYLPILQGIVMQESRAHPWALRDETANRSFFFQDRASAERAARERHARGHTLGIGWFQITHTPNWVRHFGSVANALATGFDPCTNLRAGSAHYAADYAVAEAALQRYNSGRLDGAPAYAAGVLRHVASQPPAALQPLQTAATTCPEAPPPAWDGWGTARHARRCDDAARRAATTNGDTP